MLLITQNIHRICKVETSITKLKLFPSLETLDKEVLLSKHFSMNYPLLEAGTWDIYKGILSFTIMVNREHTLEMWTHCTLNMLQMSTSIYRSCKTFTYVTFTQYKFWHPYLYNFLPCLEKEHWGLRYTPG